MDAQRSPQPWPETHQRRPPPARRSEGSLQGKHVLVAEDDASTRRAIALVLRAMGLDVVETSDGGTMLAAVTSYCKDGRTPEDLDLIVADVHMPGLNGLEVCRGVRAARWATPTIIITGDDAPDVRRMAARLGALVLSKPLDIDALEVAVRDLLTPTAPSSLSAPPASH